jgi:NAD-dependent deacetylase
MDKNQKDFVDEKNSELYDQKISRLNDMIRICKKIVFFGGAGVSTESGIPDFRSPDGLYSSSVFSFSDDNDYSVFNPRNTVNPYNLRPEQLLSRSYFDEHTKEFYDFYRQKMLFLDAQPNRAHMKLAELEQAGKNITVVTQNIDGLHQKAGSKNVLELHGSVYRNYCMNCGQSYNVKFIEHYVGVPVCSICGGIVKPDVVLYEEGLDEQVVSAVIKALSEADMVIIAGTSLSVYPAAGFLRYFAGKYAVVINLSKQALNTRCDLVFNNRVGDVMSRVDTEYCTE